MRRIGRPIFFSIAFFLRRLWHGVGQGAGSGPAIISTTAGAIPDTVPAAGWLVPPGDEAALVKALAGLMDEPGLREQLAVGSRMARRDLPDWPTVSANLPASAGNGVSGMSGFSAEWLALS